MDYIQTESVCKSEYTSCSEIALWLRFFIANQMARGRGVGLGSPCTLSTFQGTGTGNGAGTVGRMMSKEVFVIFLPAFPSVEPSSWSLRIVVAKFYSVLDGFLFD